MKIALIGYLGLLGSEFTALFLKLPKYQLHYFDIQDIDITNYQSIENKLNSLEIDLIINCAAFAQVDRCETERELAYSVNADGPKNLAKYCLTKNIKFVHFSTDYIFDGLNTQPHLEDEPPAPINYYGYTKLEGEKNIQSILKNYYIFRIQWLYGKNGPNFINKIIDLANTKPELKIIADQHGAPTWANEIAKAVISIIENPPQPGIYNIASQGSTTWYEFAQFFLAKLSIKTPIKAVTTEEFPTPAKRPNNSVLNCQKYLKLNLYQPLTWQEATLNYLKSINLLKET